VPPRRTPPRARPADLHLDDHAPAAARSRSARIGQFIATDFGNYDVRLVVDDGDGGSRTRATIDVNAPPIADGGPYRRQRRRQHRARRIRPTDADNLATLTYAWDFDGDGQFDDATGINPTFSAADSMASRVPASGDVAGHRCRRLVSTDAAVITINNVAPTVSMSGPTTGVRGQTLQFSGSFSDPDRTAHVLMAGHRQRNNVVAGVRSIVRLHAHRGGIFTVRFTVTDDDGDSGMASQQLSVFLVDCSPTTATRPRQCWSSAAPPATTRSTSPRSAIRTASK
jgi:hypothetical protein